MSKNIQMFGIVGEDITEKTVSEQLPGKGDIVVEVNSHGGSYTVGLAIYHILKKYRDENNGKVTVDILAMAGSAMATIAMAASDAKHRIMREGSRLMIHRPWGGAQGNSEEFEKRKDELLSLEKDMEIAYSENMGIPVDKIKSYMKEEKSFTAEEAEEMGFAVRVKAPSRKIKNYWKDLPSNLVPAIYAELKDEEYNPARILSKFVTTAWNDSPKRFTVEQILDSCPDAISAMIKQKAKDDGKDVVKSDCILFYKEPNGDVNINGVRAAIATVQIQDLPETLKNSARNELEAEIQKFKKSEQSKDYNWQSKIEIIQTYKGKEQIFLYSSEEIKMSKKLLDKLGVTTLEDAEKEIEELQKKAEKKEEEDSKPGAGGDPVDASVKAFMDKTNESINAFKVELETVKAEGESYKKKSEIQSRLLDEASEFKNKSILAERKETLDTLFEKEHKISPVQLEQAKADFVDIELDKVGETESLYQYAVKSYKLNKPDESGELRGSGETPDDLDDADMFLAKVKEIEKEDKVPEAEAAITAAEKFPKLYEAYNSAVTSKEI